jgi:BlaI family penicillinase repressor
MAANAEQKHPGDRREAPRISEAEWTVMKTVWRLKAATAKEIVQSLKGRAEWKPKTIHTLITRLTRKGALSAAKVGREYVFKPRVSELSCRLAASRSFLARVFDGEIAPFLACFLQRHKLSRRELAELKALLEDGTP